MPVWIDTLLEPVAMVRPRRGFIATPIIVGLNLLIWVLMVLTGAHWLDPDTDTLLAWGANLDSRVSDGEVWRLLTATFLHGGIFHLLMNMVALTAVGLELERRIGYVFFTGTYLLTGIGASLASVTMNESVVSVGASGAVFGMFGAFLSLLLLNAFHRNVRRNLIWVLLGFLIANFLDITDQGVDHWAHFGGLIGGLVLGAILRIGIPPPKPEEKPFPVPPPSGPDPTEAWHNPSFGTLPEEEIPAEQPITEAEAEAPVPETSAEEAPVSPDIATQDPLVPELPPVPPLIATDDATSDAPPSQDPPLP